MNTLFIIPEHASEELLEQQYLLCLAMLNFDHQVTLVFTGDVFSKIGQNETQTKQWLALNMYGVEAMYALNPSANKKLPAEISIINHADLTHLRKQMDFIS